MGWPALIPAAASLLCLEVAAIFAFLYAKISHRKADLAFSVLALWLAWMRWASLLRREAATADVATLWLRLEWAGGFVSLAIFLHFVSLAVERPLGRRSLALLYALAASLLGLTWTDWLVRPPAGSVAVLDLEAQSHGPALPLLAPLLFASAAAGLAAILRRGAKADGLGLAPLAQHRRHTFWAGMVLILAPFLAWGADRYLPGLRWLSWQSLAAVAFCLIIARALGKDVLRAEAERRRLAQLAQFRGQAVRDVAHELKNPLAAIQMATQTVLDGAQCGIEPAEQCRILEMCLDACRRLTRLINNMLDTARMESGRTPELRIEETDLPALAESVLSLQANTTQVHRLVLESDLRVPTVSVDGDKVHQVLTNLVHNAIKYSPGGGDIVVRLWEKDDRVGISVADGGIGMTPEQQARIFRPFERVVDPNRRITGTGIGLHLVKRLVEAHGGEITVASREGEGSTFTVLLPAARME